MRQVPLRQFLDYHPCTHPHASFCTKYHDIVGPTSSTMVAVYDYRRPSKTPWTPIHLRDMNNCYHYRRREPLLPLRHVYDYFPRRHVNNYLLYDRYVNVYFPLRTRSARNARFEGITPRRCPWTECMLYEMPVFASCPFVTRFHATIPWEPGRRDHPTIFCMFRTSARLLLHRYLHELPGPECCRGTIFVSPPWHPFCSAMVTKCFITCSCQHFHKIA